MRTALVYGNGNLLINVNDRLNISDLYWPHVGQENHLGKVSNEIFMTIDSQLTYLKDPQWTIEAGYEEDSLVGRSIARNQEKEIEIKISEGVLPDKDIHIRYFAVTNKSDKEVELIFFIKNNFYMLEDDVGDTAIWYPPARSLVHYKKSRFLGLCSTDKIYQFTCASPQDNNGKGAFPNVAGELVFNPVSTGSAQSCISHKFIIAPGDTVSFDNFIVCAHNLDELKQLAEYVRSEGSGKLISNTSKYWQNWVRGKVTNYFGEKPPRAFAENDLNEKILELYKRSLLIIRTQFDNGGAIIAANDSTFVKAGGKDTYSYFWPRDGALVSLALIEVGFGDLVKKFFDYCKNILHTDGYILHKYYPNKNHGLASSWHPWVDKGGNLQLPIQEDETALVIYAIWKHYERFGDQEFLNQMWESFIFPAAEFLFNYRYGFPSEKSSLSDSVSGFLDKAAENPMDSAYEKSGLPRPSYDIWEIERGLFTYTVATVYAGLNAAALLADKHGNDELHRKYNQAAQEVKEGMLEHLVDKKNNIFVKSIKCDPLEQSCSMDKSMDSSFFALWAFEMFAADDPLVENTMLEVEKKLWVNNEVGGMARKENDWYHRDDESIQGNPWFNCTLWMAQYWLMKKDKQKAEKYLKWVILHTDNTGLMAEQADPHTGYAKSVKPLTWSHAEFVKTINLLKHLAE